MICWKKLSMAVAAFAALCALSVSAHADYPDKPIRLIIGAPPGGTSDAMARVVQQGVEKRLGQPLVIENRPGAGGMLAFSSIVKAEPDGYTLGLSGAGAFGAILGLQKMSYDPRKDLLPVASLATTPLMLAATPSFKVENVGAVVAMAKGDGAKGATEKFAIAHGGTGTSMHLTAELFSQVAGITIDLVPYRGNGPLLNDLIGGHVALGIVDVPSAASAIESGQIKMLAIASKKRFPGQPNVPTFAEAGLPGVEGSAWLGIVAPPGTPAEIVTKLNDAFVTVLRDPEVIERFRMLNSEPLPMSPTEFSAFVNGEIDKWVKVAEKAPKRD